MANELLEAAKELLNDFDLYGNPIQLRVIGRLRRATEAAQQSAQRMAFAVGGAGVILGLFAGWFLWCA